MLDEEKLSNFINFNDFLSKYKDYLYRYTYDLLDEIDSKNWEMDPLLSLFIDDCNLNKLDFSKGGAHYNNYGLTSVSLSNTINSLYNVKKLVFEDKLYTLDELNNLRKDNFKDENVIKTLNNQPKFGMDNKEIIDLTNDILDFTDELFKIRTNKFGAKFKFGLSAPSYIAKSPNIKASFDGRRNFEPFNVHISNEDNKDYTELMRFASKLHYTESRFNGNVVDFMVTPDFINKNFDKFRDFLKISLNMGVFQMQLNVVDSKTLIDAQSNPDEYLNLIVRVWGFSTYFKDLPKDYQDVLIKRALENEGKNH
jgi:formate C-acetyltransferase